MTYISNSSGKMILAEEVVRPRIFSRQTVISKELRPQTGIVGRKSGMQFGTVFYLLLYVSVLARLGLALLVS